MHVREPLVDPVDISDLRPTQITVGMHEVRVKRESWQSKKDKAEFLGRHMIPVIRGPKERFYIVDQHHLARALHDEGQKHVLVSVITDLRMLDRDAFWVFLDNRGWCHPYDQRGRRCPFTDIPKSVADLHDDPYRSLAGELRKAGGFAKDTTPFSEFLWADFLRRRLGRGLVKPRSAADFGLDHKVSPIRRPATTSCTCVVSTQPASPETFPRAAQAKAQK